MSSSIISDAKQMGYDSMLGSSVVVLLGSKHIFIVYSFSPTIFVQMANTNFQYFLLSEYEIGLEFEPNKVGILGKGH